MGAVDARVSRTVLRAPRGEIPRGTLPTRAQKDARFHFQERVGRGLDRPLRSTAITAALSVKKGNLEQFHGVRLQIVMEMMGILVSENSL